MKNPTTEEVYDATEILPEYFYISVPVFNDVIEREIDEWLYVMKHDEIPHPFKSKYMEQVAEKLSILKMSQEERAGYYNYLKKIYSDRDELQASQARGVTEGMQQGKEEEKLAIAKNMLNKGADAGFIQDVTGLSKETIENIK